VRREVIGLNEAEQSFRATYEKERWFVSVVADHDHARLKVMVRDLSTAPSGSPGWKHQGFPVWLYPAPPSN